MMIFAAMHKISPLPEGQQTCRGAGKGANPGFMTHLCHKPVGGGGRDSAVQQPIWCPPQAWAVLFSLDRAPSHGPRMGGTDEDLPSTARLHRNARWRGGLATRGSGTA